MRELIRDSIERTRRSGDRIGVEGQSEAKLALAADVIRLARLATSIHLTDAARLMAVSSSAPDRASVMREPAR